MLDLNKQVPPEFYCEQSRTNVFALKVSHAVNNTVFPLDKNFESFFVSDRILVPGHNVSGFYYLITDDGIERFMAPAIFEALYTPVQKPVGLPVYQCHKQVRAAKIIDIRTMGSIHKTDFYHLHLDDATIAFMQVTPDWYQKHRPSVGGYFVQYEDGYQSYSPARAFESGYTKLAA